MIETVSPLGNPEAPRPKVASPRLHGETEEIDQDQDVLTPNGAVPIKDIEPGDIVYGPGADGVVCPTRVLKKFDLGVREVVEMIRYGRVVTSARPEQGWAMTQKVTRNGGPVRTPFVGETRMLKGNGLQVTRALMDIPGGEVHEPHAYALGAFLGNGCCTRWTSKSLDLSCPDEWVPVKVADILGAGFRKTDPKGYVYKITNAPKLTRAERRWNQHPPVELHHVGLLAGKKAHQKAFPLEIVDTWDRQSRMAMLAGLIDTDGSVFKVKGGRGLTMDFTSTSRALADLCGELIYDLFQIRPTRTCRKGDSQNRPAHGVIICSTANTKRVLRQVDPHLVSPRKKWRSEYEELSPSQSGIGIGVKLGRRHLARTYGLLVDNDSHCYLLANEGLVAHDLWGEIFDAMTCQVAG